MERPVIFGAGLHVRSAAGLMRRPENWMRCCLAADRNEHLDILLGCLHKLAERKRSPLESSVNRSIMITEISHLTYTGGIFL